MEIGSSIVITMKNKTITFRCTDEDKKEFKRQAKKKGFKNMTGFIFWLLKNSGKFAIMFLFLTLAGCSTISYLPSNNIQSYAPSQSVEVLYEKPTKPYVVLGRVSINAMDILSDQTILNRLKQKAMSLGADAIIVDNMQRVFTKSQQGLAIKYKNNPPVTPSQ